MSEIIRCRECAFLRSYFSGGMKYRCLCHLSETVDKNLAKANGFCSLAKAKNPKV